MPTPQKLRFWTPVNAFSTLLKSNRSMQPETSRIAPEQSQASHSYAAPDVRGLCHRLYRYIPIASPFVLSVEKLSTTIVSIFGMVQLGVAAGKVISKKEYPRRVTSWCDHAAQPHHGPTLSGGKRQAFALLTFFFRHMGCFLLEITLVVTTQPVEQLTPNPSLLAKKERGARCFIFRFPLFLEERGARGE